MDNNNYLRKNRINYKIILNYMRKINFFRPNIFNAFKDFNANKFKFISR